MKLTIKQNEYIRNSNKRLNLKIGAVRSGKSFVDMAYTVPARIRAVSGKDGLNVLIGVSRDTIERNILQPMREIYTDKLIGTINSRNIAKVCGEDVYCLGAEKISQVAKIQGSSIKYCYGDEIAKWNKEVFMMLLSRLDKSYSRLDGACNPEGPNHWLKKFLDNPIIDAYIQHYTIFDNPNLPQEYVENLCREYEGTVYFGRLIEGEWTLAEGLIYPMYQTAIVEALPVGIDGKTIPASEYVVSIDYGTMNAFAAILWSKRGSIWCGEREYYYSGRNTGIQKTDEEYASDLDKWIADIWEVYQEKYYGAGKISAIIDPSAASFIALLKKREWCKVRAADNAVNDGIRETAVCMQMGLIKLLRGAMQNTINELGGYVWDETSVEERPVKIDDHGCDAIRYFCKTMRIAAKNRQQSLM